MELDKSADNYIMKTDVNGRFKWDEVDNDKCFKIDHGSMIKCKSKTISVDKMSEKPMKDYCTPPEIFYNNESSDGVNLEAFNVYQMCAMFIFLLLGQAKKNGIWYTLCLDEKGRISDESLGFNPKLHIPDDLGFLSEGIAETPSKRLSLDKLAEKLVKAKDWDNDKLLDGVMGNLLPRNRRKGKNNLFAIDNRRSGRYLNQFQREESDDESESDDDDDDEEYTQIIKVQKQKTTIN